MVEHAKMKGHLPVRHWLAVLFTQLRHPSLARTAMASAAIRMSAIFLGFIASLIYARTLGPHDYGLYAYVMAWVAVTTIVAGLGIPNLLMREATKDVPASHSLLKWANKRLIVTGLVTATLFMMTGLLSHATGAALLFIIAAPLPLINNMNNVRQSLLQASGQITQSLWPQQLLLPSVIVSSLIALFLIGVDSGPAKLMLLTFGASLIALLCYVIQLGTHAERPRTPRTNHVSIKAALPFMWLAGLYLLNSRIDMLMLGSIKGATEVGVYSVASRIAELVLFFSAAVNTTIAPKVVALYERGDHDGLQRLVHKSARAYLIATTPIAITFLTLASTLLPWLYGAAYSPAVAILQILTLGQFYVIALGSVGTLLTMTGNERLCMKGVGIGVAANILLNTALIPVFGTVGAAISTSSSLILTQTILWYWVRRRLSLRTSGLAL